MSTPVEEFCNPLACPSNMENGPEQPDYAGNEGSHNAISYSKTRRRSSDDFKPREKKRVGFTGSVNIQSANSTAGLAGELGENNNPSRRGSDDPSSTPQGSELRLPELSIIQAEQIRQTFQTHHEAQRPKPAIRPVHPHRSSSFDDAAFLTPDFANRRDSSSRSAQQAFERGKQLERDQQSSPSSRAASPDGSTGVQKYGIVPTISTQEFPEHGTEKNHVVKPEEEASQIDQARNQLRAEAFELVQRHTDSRRRNDEEILQELQSAPVTPIEERDFIEDYQPRPSRVRGGILGSLLKLHNQSSNRPARRHSNEHSETVTPLYSPTGSGNSTPNGGRPWYLHKRAASSATSVAQLFGYSPSLGSPAASEFGEEVSRRLKEKRKRPYLHRRSRSNFENEIRITHHIAETICRQRYLMKLCRALMQYGAPTHRLEEYMRMSARVLEIDAQFLYIPGAMIMSFDDPETHTTEVKLVKVNHGLDLGKLRDVHELYKEVLHDRIGVEEATQRLKEVTAKTAKHGRWMIIFFHGLATLCVGPFAFDAQITDLPVAFFLGCIVGALQVFFAPASDLYANVFEVLAAVITSFLARAFGSINGGQYFCFSSIAQSSIALILPGYTVLSASLELQSRQMVAGSVRMVYALIYSLFLGFGITIGTVVYGLIDSNASSTTTCQAPIAKPWAFLFVPGMTISMLIVNQAKWKQAPIMVFISCTSYVVTYFSSTRFAGNTQISSSLGALVIGLQANLYSRLGNRMENWCLDIWEDSLRPRWRTFRKKVFLQQPYKQSPKVLEEGKVKDDEESTLVRHTRRVGYSLAAAAMLPAIFIQVPSGLAINGSLLSGISSANQITGKATNGTQVVNSTTILASHDLNSVAFSVGYSVIQVSIGITVGLFLSAIIVYPWGKKRSGLFSY